jgi:DivIVA domain-containing protein
MRKRKPEPSDIDEGSAAREQASGPSRAGRLTPLDIQQIEFRRSFKGYDEREVDEFLDRLTEDFAAALDEAQRLRDRAEGGLGAVVTGGTPTGSKRAADEIVQRARDDAARIVREAKERATAIGAAALGPGTSSEAAVRGAGDRATIAPFIAKEREFLTSLATLVQGHAEAVRGMASSAQKAGAPATPAQEAGPRPGTTTAGTTTGTTTGTGTEPRTGPGRESGKQPGQRAPEPRRASTATPTTPTSSPATPPTTTPPAPPATDPMPAAMPTPSTERTARKPETARPAKPSEGSGAPTPPGEGHVTVPDPDPAGAKRGDHKLAEGDPSLRELFWGEE